MYVLASLFHLDSKRVFWGDRELNQLMAELFCQSNLEL